MISHMINGLSKECNEFQQYCVRKGVAREELMPLTQASSMEDVILATFRNCERRLKREDDRQALSKRHQHLAEMIASTKLAILTYSNRISALLSSTLFHFSNRIALPAQLTPLIKPLIESLNSEISPALIEAFLGPAFFSLLRATARREPCPHSKVLRQLCLGLVHSDIPSKSAQQWSTPEHQNRILSMDILDPDGGSNGIQQQKNSPNADGGIKARNCALILRYICRKYSDRIEQECVELVKGQCCSLNLLSESIREDEPTAIEIQSHLLQLDSLRTVFSALSPADLRHRIIHERVRPVAPRLFALLAHSNPVVRFRISRFLADLAVVELCPMLSICYAPLNQMISGPLSDSTTARCGAVELLARLASIGAPVLLGAVSLLTPLALRAISDQQEEVRKAAAYAFRQLVTLLPLENRSQHFLHELASCDDLSLRTAYESAFALVDLLCSPANLPRINEIHGLRADVQLRDYQLEGITWLSFLHKFGLNGILADDMGLGKTLQVLCLFSWDQAQRSNSYPHYSLIVCPKTLVQHWCNEWRTFFPSTTIPMIKLTDYKQKKEQHHGADEAIVVISYEELRANRSLLIGDRIHGRWNYLVLDEGHCIRNSQSQLFDCCCSIRAIHRLILSGTPVQNSPADLWALFHFLMPGYLSSRAQFQARFIRHIQACRNPRATEEQCKKGEQALKQLHKLCLPFVMRRLKSEVLAELPEKIVQDQQCELTSVQRELYGLVVDRCALQQRGKKDEDNEPFCWLSPLQALQTLRKLVDHPGLIQTEMAKHRIFESTHSEQAKRMQKEMEKKSIEQSGKMMALRDILAQCQISDRIQQPPGSIAADVVADETNDAFSSTFAAPVIQQLLPVASGTHRALIFCQWRGTVELIINFLNEGAFGPDISWLRLDASVPAKERQCVVDTFNNDPSIDLLLLTTHIGGVGLNLTGADTVIFVDHDWNPFRDLQAIDRAHRIGQKRTVNVYRLITRGTIEDKVMRLQRFKEDTANALVGADNRSLAGMSTDELLGLFSLGESDGGQRGATTAKRAKRMEDDGKEGGEWTMDELWTMTEEGEGEGDHWAEQYSQQHNVTAFVKIASSGTNNG